MNRQQRWFPLLTPPPGGYQRLDAALAAERAHQRSWRAAPWLLASACGVLVLAVLLVFQLPKGRPDPVARAMQAAILQPVHVVSVVDGGAVEVASASENVRVFLLMSP